MKGFRFGFLAFLCLWLATGCQRTVAPSLGVANVTPDFFLVVSGCLGLFTNRRTATVLGFLSGLLEGAIAGANLAAYAVSRTVGGFLVGWLASMDLDGNPIMAGVVVAILTLLSQILVMFIAPSSGIGAFLLATIGAAVYNGVLAMPLYALLRRTLDPPAR